MKKKFSYLLATLIGLITAISYSATAFACGGDMGYMPPESNIQITTFQYGKSTIVVTSRPYYKAYEGSKVIVDGVEMMLTRK